VGATVNGELIFNNAAFVGGQVATSGDATLNLGGQSAFSVLVTMPAGFVTGQLGSSLVKIGNITYNVSQVDFTVSGFAIASTSGSGILGAFVHFGLSAQPTLSDGTLGDIATFSVNCGNAFTICPAVNSVFTASALMHLTVSQALLLSVFHITTQMSEDLQLTTAFPNSNNATINAVDPFDITSMELLDANGVPIPGVTFVADDGTIFPDAADTATPIPATLPLFATGLGAIGLLGWRRKRKAQATI
jgi:hypothetical protein